MKKKSIVVAVSGSGRSLINLVEYSRSRECQFRVAGVISSSQTCGGFKFAKSNDLPVFFNEFPKAGLSNENLGKLTEWLEMINPAWIALAGFLKFFPVDHPFIDRTINIHPSLLPAFGGSGMYGMNVHRAVIASGVRLSGATIHRVSAVYDEGPVLAQVEVPTAGYDAEGLAGKVFSAEKLLYPEVLNRLCDGRLPRSDGQVWRVSVAELMGGE